MVQQNRSRIMGINCRKPEDVITEKPLNSHRCSILILGFNLFQAFVSGINRAGLCIGTDLLNSLL